MRDLLGPYGQSDPSGSGDPFDYDSDGLPFDAPDGYEPGSYWLREQLLSSTSREEQRKAEAWQPHASDLDAVLAHLRAHGVDKGTLDSSDVWRSATSLGYSMHEALRLEEALYRAGRLRLTGKAEESDGGVRLHYQVTSEAS
jgi:hypothetical protein